MGLRNPVSMGVVSAPRRAISDENPIPRKETDASMSPMSLNRAHTVICHRHHIFQKLNLHTWPT